MNKYITKRSFIIINVLLVFLEIVLCYVILNSFLSKDLITPFTFKS